MRKKPLKIIILSVVLLAGILLLHKIWQAYYDRRCPNFSQAAELYVYPGATPDSVKALVSEKCRPTNGKSWSRAMASVSSVRPGHYTVDKSCSSLYVARMLSHGWQTPVNLVLSGTMRQQGAIARKISRQLLLDSLDVICAMRDSALLASLDFTPDQVFALFMPDTYQVYWTDSMPSVLKVQKAAYDAFWTQENREKAKKQGLTPLEVSILASIVNGETNHEPEMPSIAGVYLNRLHIGMPLQADPTVSYCFDYTINRVLRKHTEVDSPFNTYMHVGLPPAPICVPTKAALQAVLDPDKHQYLFFCASPAFDGTHLFAATLSEHNRNAVAYQRALDVRNRSKSVIR